METNKKKIIVAIALIAIMALVGVQTMAVFGTNTGVYQLEKTSYTASVGEQISVTGMMWIEVGGDYSVTVQRPNYDFVDNAATRTFGTVTKAGVWTFTIPVTVTKGGEYVITGVRGNTVLGSTRLYVTIPSSDTGDTGTGTTPTKPGDRCDGTTKVTHYLSNNVWVPDYIQNSIDCGYVAPPTTASIFIDASPDGGLTVDGIIRGNTPMTVSDLSIGSHVISIKKDGYKELTETVTISTGSNAKSYYLEQIPTDDGTGEEEPPTDTDTDQNSLLLTALLLMVLVVVILGGVFVYVKR